MISVKITNEMKTKAREIEKQILANISGDNPNGFEEPDRYYVGMIGELAFKRCLDRIGVKNKHLIATGYKYNNPDFIIYQNGKPHRVDIKTASKSHHKKILVAPRSYQHKFELYVGTRLQSDHNFCDLIGYVRFENLKKFKINNIDAMGCELDRLTDIETLIERADNGYDV